MGDDLKQVMQSVEKQQAAQRDEKEKTYQEFSTEVCFQLIIFCSCLVQNKNVPLPCSLFSICT